jgi:serine/threonine protein kinase/tetratricopeptide (TPR) repeat protein
MPSSARRHELPAGDEIVMTRCPVCGRRIVGVCPVDGQVAGAEPDSSQVWGPVSPSFAGYRILRLVARGGFGTVFAAEPEGGGAPVAIKLPRPDRADAWLCLSHEMAVLADVGAPHVPALLGHGALADGAPYLVMDYLTAPTLAARLLGRVDPVPVAEACVLVLSILDALQAVHAKGYVHCDLKPENIFVAADQHVTLVDFGLVTALEIAGHEGGSRSRTRESTFAGVGVGTAEYMSPEQCEGRGDIDGRADLYAMGVILFELCAGHPPFWGPRTVVREGHLSRRPPRLSTVVGGKDGGAPAVPRALDEVVARCLAKDRQDRYADVTELRAALTAALERVVTPARQASRPPPARTTMRSPAAAPSPSASGPAPQRDRDAVGLLFFVAGADVVTVQALFTPLGGQLAYAANGRYVAAFGHETGDNPARRALGAAEEVLRQGLALRVRVDLAPVAVQTRKDGSKRFMSALFTRADRFPADAGPVGLSLAPAAAAVLPDVVTTAGTASTPPRPSAPPLPHSEADPTAEMAGWPMIGRDAVLDALVAGAKRAAEERVPATASVVGDAGHGKSHLFKVLVKRLGETGVAEVLALRAQKPALGDADHTLAELLQRALDLPATAPPDGGRELLRERLGPIGSAGAPPTSKNREPGALGPTGEASPPAAPAELGPAVALALGWIDPDAPDSAMRPELRALGAAPGALRSALTVAAGEALRRRAATRPLFVVLDDAHYASDVLLSALEYATLSESGGRLWICALGRPAFEQQAPTWGERAGRREQHRLGPLDAGHATTLCRRLLLPVESVADSAVQRLVERAQAIPLLLVELVRGLRREGIVRKSPKGEAWYLATDELDRLPDLPLIEWLARSELDALAPTLRGHARLLALLGEQVVHADVAGLLLRLEQEGGDLEFPLDGRVASQRLLAAGIVVEDRDGRIGFRHALVRETIAHGTPEALRRRIHHAAALHYLGTAATSSDEHPLAQLAYHAGEAGMGAVAERAYLDLAERARARHAYTDAERLYSRALEQRGEAGPVERAGAYRGRGLMRSRIGRYHDALTDFSCARAMVEEQGDTEAQVGILLDEATAFEWLNEFKSSEERVEQARALSERGSSPLLSARLLLGRGRSAHRFSRDEEGAALMERAAAEAEPLGDEGYETRVIALSLLGFIYQGLSRLDDAQRALAETIALCEEHGDRLHLGAAFSNRSPVWSCLGDKERMAADSERALVLAREFGQTTLEFIGEFNLGEMLLMLDDDEAAEPHIQRALTLDRRLSGAEIRPAPALLEAKLHLYRGDKVRVRAILERIRAREVEARTRGEADALLVPSEEVLWSMLDLATQQASDAAWDELEERARRYAPGYEEIEVVESRALWEGWRGNANAARRHLVRALEMVTRVPNALGARLRRRLSQIDATSRAEEEQP